MKIHFETYGPFALKREQNYAVSTAEIKEFWDDIAEVEPGLELAIGVYIVSVRSRASSKSKPWYVGKTDKGFRPRLVQHAAGFRLFPALNTHAPKGDIEVLFVARRSTDGKKFKQPKAPRGAKSISKSHKHGSIDFLEDLLIGACVAQNKKLLNIQKMSRYKNIAVPGLMNEGKGKPTKSAIYLKELLA
jgi:hypothetical protein